MKNFERFIYAYTSELKKHGHIIRKGQIAFNTLDKLFPDLAKKIVGTKYDPFYDDSKLNSFFKYIFELLNVKEE